MARRSNLSEPTILHYLKKNAREIPDRPAYGYKVNGTWKMVNWRDYYNEIRQAAKALIALGMQPGENVCILGFNRPEWVVFDLAGMLAGGAAAGIYTTNSPAEVRYIVAHAEARFILLEDAGQWAKIDAERANMPHLQRVIMMRGVKIDDPLALTWEEFMALGNSVDDQSVDERLGSLKPEQLATLIYTSGTTGPPKGVMLSHRNLVWTAEAVRDLNASYPDDSVLSYLPLSHIAEQMFTIHGAIVAGYKVYYAESALKVLDNLKEIQPTIVFGVPRVWERFYNGVSANLAHATGAKAMIANWARGVGTKVTDLRNMGKEPSGLLKLQNDLADKLVFSTVREGIGLNHARACVSGAAPINPTILEFFGSLGIRILEVYGQSEDCGPTSFNQHKRARFGSVGPAVPGVEVKIADDGEILVRGPNVFLGYYKEPAATAETLADGWLFSGDLGKFDADGFLHITGRKKEIIITSGGKNIAPKNIEAALTDIPLVGAAMVIGEQRRFLTALLTLEPEAKKRFAAENGIALEDAHTHPKTIEAVQKGVDEVNSHFARVEHVRKFTILPGEFTIEGGELTPTLKLKRRIVNQKYTAEIEAMYAE